MHRTADRPLPSGRLIAGRALVFGVALSIAGFVELWLGVNPPQRRDRRLHPGQLSLPVHADEAAHLVEHHRRRDSRRHAAGDRLSPPPPALSPRESWVLFAILFLWQFPHFYSIAWMYKEDYARAGIRMLPVVDPDCRSTARQIVLYGIALIPVSLVPAMLGMSGRIYLIGALLLGLWFLYSGVRVALERTLVRARGVLITSVLYLPLIYGLMLLDRPGL